MLVDIFTGRIMDGSLSDGLHQALEAKEGLPVTDENQTQASITIQNFFRMYPSLSGMTGTAKQKRKNLTVYIIWKLFQFQQIVLSSVKINKTLYTLLAEKYKAVREEVLHIHQKQRPILIGTMSILQSETVARYLDEAKLPYQLLNAKAPSKKLI